MGHKIDEHIMFLRLSAHVTRLCNVEPVWNAPYDSYEAEIDVNWSL